MNPFFWIAPIVVMAVGVLPMPYGYYTLSRLVVCGCAAYFVFQLIARKDIASAWIFGFVAILYNPVFPVSLGEKSIWMVVNLVTAILFLSKIKMPQQKEVLIEETPQERTQTTPQVVSGQITDSKDTSQVRMQKTPTHDPYRNVHGKEPPQSRVQGPFALGDKFEKTPNQRHYYLNDKDRCYFLGQYAAGQGREYNETNRLVLEFKDGEAQAITEVAQYFKRAMKNPRNNKIVFVPVPSSSQDESTRKDRIEKMLHEANVKNSIVKKLVRQTVSTVPNHRREKTNRMTPEELEAIYAVVGIKHNAVKVVAIVDDVLTSGAHFRAMSNVLKRSMPDVSIIGLFIARTMKRDEIDEDTDIDNNPITSADEEPPW